MIVEVTEKMLAWAKRREQAFKEGPHYNHDFETDGNRLAGYVGEVAFWKNYQEALHCDASTYDFILNLQRYDIKSYRTDYNPLPHYGVCVTDKDLKERGGSANYFWAAVSYDYTSVTLLGWLPYDEFVSLAKFWKKGETKPPGFVYPVNCWEVAISQLHPPMVSRKSRKEEEALPPIPIYKVQPRLFDLLISTPT